MTGMTVPEISAEIMRLQTLAERERHEANEHWPWTRGRRQHAEASRVYCLRAEALRAFLPIAEALSEREPAGGTRP